MNPIGDDDYKREINYEGFRNVDELKLLKSGQFERYTYLQCLKICYYMQKVRNKEILQMMAEFVRDDTDNIWFVHANRIQYRPCQNILKIPGFANEE